MPSKSPAQHRLMEAAAHTKGGYGGVPQSVGNDFVTADKKKGLYRGGAGDHARALHEKAKAQAKRHGG